VENREEHGVRGLWACVVSVWHHAVGKLAEEGEDIEADVGSGAMVSCMAIIYAGQVVAARQNVRQKRNGLKVSPEECLCLNIGTSARSCKAGLHHV
jgi:hypothetical protein